MNQQIIQFAAHELLGMQEALLQKTANVEILSFLGQQVQDGRLRGMLEQHARTINDHYVQGVRILQGHATTQAVQQTHQQIMSAQPKLGLNNFSIPAPSMDSGAPSDRTVASTALALYKFGAIAWTTLALECINPQLRSFLMDGAAMCDRLAYDMWSYMNQRGYYQVPTLQNTTTQAMVQAYQMPQNPGSMNTAQMMPFIDNYQ